MPYHPRHTLAAISFLLLPLFQCFAQADIIPPIAPQPAPLATRTSEIRGIWIHTYGPYDWDTVMKKIAAAGFNCVFVRVARGMNAIYPSQYLPRDGWAEAAGGDEMQRALDAAHRNGLEFHAWKVCFNSNAATRTGPGPRAFHDPMVAEDRVSRDPAGTQATFLTPGDPRNEELEFNVMLELATKYNVDGVHFDYIRYTEEPSYDFDYGDVSRREFEKATGKVVFSWPADVYSGPRKLEYEDWERDNINRLVRRVYEAVKKAKPQVQVSAAVWRKHRLYRAALKQDWLRWVQEGWLDFVVPMDYTADAEDFRETVRAQVANTAGKMPIAAGIASYMQKTPEDLLKQIEIARQEDTDGYVLFAYKTEGFDEMLDALAKGPQSQPAYPAYRAPDAKAVWPMSRGIERKDDVPAYAI
ncbi:MAG TPA: family 10 glycosylhydrolase, partial [Abditibacteriaceae bacterium]|nr:family 10 glycosylhydrolase [Abditibacteriaceae bacterium]